MSMHKRQLAIGVFLLSAAASMAWAAPEDVRFGGGFFDGWDRHAMTNSAGLGGVLVSLSSGTNQTYDFTATPALSAVTITAEDPAGTITNGGTIHLTVPAAWKCRFDTNATVTLGGGAAGKVGAAGYADSGRTLTIPVTNTFAAGDTLTISGLRLADLRLVPPDTKRLELDYTGDGARDKYDDFSLTVRALWPGGFFDGWDRNAMTESKDLTPGGRGTVITIR